MPAALSFRMPAKPSAPPTAPAPAPTDTAPTRGRSPRRRLAKLDPASKTYYANFRSGTKELHSARSADGAWSFERDETPGTPWAATHHLEPEGTALFPTITSARAAAVDGTAIDKIRAQAATAAKTATAKAVAGDVAALVASHSIAQAG